MIIYGSSQAIYKFISVSIVIVRYFLSQCHYYLTIKTNWSRYNTKKRNIFIFLNVRKADALFMRLLLLFKGTWRVQNLSNALFLKNKKIYLKKTWDLCYSNLKIFKKLIFGIFQVIFWLLQIFFNKIAKIDDVTDLGSLEHLKKLKTGFYSL